jgi:hypothetical protein
LIYGLGVFIIFGLTATSWVLTYLPRFGLLRPRGSTQYADITEHLGPTISASFRLVRPSLAIQDTLWEEIDITGEEMEANKAAQTNRKMTAVEKLRSMLADPEKFIACPGVYDGFTARIALREGVDCLYMVSLT